MPRGHEVAAKELRMKNAELEHHYALYGKPDEPGITTLEPGLTAINNYLSVSNSKAHDLTKTALSANLELINKDGKYHTLVLTSSAVNIRKNLRSGQFEPKKIPNPLAKMIAQIGEYRREVKKRARLEKNYGPKTPEKLDIADLTQDWIEALHDLHSSINNFDISKDAKGNATDLLAKLDRFLGKMKELQKNIISQKRFQQEPYLTLLEGIESLVKQAGQYKTSWELRLRDPSPLSSAEMVDSLKPYGDPQFTFKRDLNLMHFLQGQINLINEYSVAANNMVTPRWRLLMGSDPLGRALLEARMKTGEKFSNSNIDYHNPVHATHAFDFASLENAEGQLKIDLGTPGFDPKRIHDLTDWVQGFIDTEGGVSAESEIINLNCKEDKRGWFTRVGDAILRIPSVTWRMGGNFLKDIGGFLADLVVGIPTYLFLKTPYFPSSHSPLLQKKQAHDSHYQGSDLFKELDGKTQVKNPSFLETAIGVIGSGIKTFIAKPVWELVAGPVKNIWNNGLGIWHDLTIRTKPLDGIDHNNNDSVMSGLLAKWLAEDAEKEKENKNLIDGYKQSFKEGSFTDPDAMLKDLEEIQRKKNLKYAAVPYHLKPDEPSDVFSWAANEFIRDIAEVFSHEIYRGHPLAGLAFTAAASTAAPFMIPATQNIIFAAVNKSISVPLGHTLVNAQLNGLTPGLSLALIQGKIAFLCVDALNGTDSMVAKGLKLAIENPILATTICMATTSFGMGLASGLIPIPGVDAMVKDETMGATFPYFELALTGAKIAAIVVENLIVMGHENHTSVQIELIQKTLQVNKEKLIQSYEEDYRKQNPGRVPSDSEKNEFYTKFAKTFQNDFLKINLPKTVIATSVEAKKELAGKGMIPDSLTQRMSMNPMKTLQSIQNINALSRLNLDNRSAKDLAQLMHYVEVEHRDNPEYVASVRQQLYGEKEKEPFVGSIKVFYSNIFAFPRMLVSLAQRAWFGAKASWYEGQRNKVQGGPRSAEFDKKYRDSQIAAFAAGDNVVAYFSKAAADFGRLVKGIGNIMRKASDLTFAILQNIPETLMLAILGKKTGKLRSKLASAAFAPGKISQGLDAATGSLRSLASAKNLQLASRDAMLKKIANDPVFEVLSGKNKVNSGSINVTTPAPAKTTNTLTHQIEDSLLGRGHPLSNLSSALTTTRVRTFNRDNSLDEITRSISTFQTSGLSKVPTQSLPKMANPVRLLPQQCRVIETEIVNPITPTEKRELMIVEKMSKEVNKLHSQLIIREQDFNAVMKNMPELLACIHQQVKSSVQALKGNGRDTTGEMVTISLQPNHSPAMQEAYVLYCIKMGCICKNGIKDEQEQEGVIYDPNGPQFNWEMNRKSFSGSEGLEAYKTNNQELLNLNLDPPKATVLAPSPPQPITSPLPKVGPSPVIGEGGGGGKKHSFR